MKKKESLFIYVDKLFKEPKPNSLTLAFHIEPVFQHILADIRQDDGKIDAAELQREMRLWVDQIPNGASIRTNPKVVDAEEHRFLQKRYNNRYNWEPTPEIEEAIVKAIFG